MATSIKGIGNYQDWDLVCDNTGTCRMAGYQEKGDARYGKFKQKESL